MVPWNAGGMEMKEFWKEVRMAAIMGFLVPGLLLWFGTALLDISKEEEPPEPTQSKSI